MKPVNQLKPNKQTGNKLFYLFYGKTALKPISYAKMLEANKSMAKMSKAKIPDTNLVI